MNNKSIYLVIMLITTTALLISGCAINPTNQPEQPPLEGKSNSGATTPEEESDILDQEPVETESSPDAGKAEQRASQTPPPDLERVEITPPIPVTGEVPSEIMDKIIADLVKRTGAERGDIQVVRAEAVVWNDGSLGCPKPGEFYIQILINGYWVVLNVEGEEYDYRVSEKGYFTLCEGRGELPISPPGELDPGPSSDQ